jgi:protein ImuA
MVHSVSGEIQQLLSHPQLWRAGELGMTSDAQGHGIGSGYFALDKLLAGGGWPRDGLVELLADRVGIGELRLMAPALAALSRQEHRWLIWINPPHIPYAHALAALGIAVERVLLVHPKRHEDALWSLEQALKSGTCSAALAWLDERRLTVKDLRRLQLAARQGGTLTTLFRPLSAAGHSSMAELRILLEPGPVQVGAGSNLSEDAGRDLLQLEVVKRRGGWPVAPFSLQLQQPLIQLTAAELREHVECWRVRARQWQTAGAAAEPAAMPPARQPALATSSITPIKRSVSHVRRA